VTRQTRRLGTRERSASTGGVILDKPARYIQGALASGTNRLRGRQISGLIVQASAHLQALMPGARLLPLPLTRFGESRHS
jgi:hypothetical protein